MAAMTFEECRELCFYTLEKFASKASNVHFGEADLWTFEVEDVSRRVYGYCNLNARRIVLSKKHFDNGTKEGIEDTILHEVAHALAGFEFTGKRLMVHGKLWKKWAVMVGATPKAVTHDKTRDTVEEEYGDYRYFIISIIRDVVTVESACQRRLVRLNERMVGGKPETEGRLYHIRSEHYTRLKGQTEKIKNVAFV